MDENILAADVLQELDHHFAVAELRDAGFPELHVQPLRDLLRGYCGSPLGQDRVTALEPSIDRSWIDTQHQLTAEIREFRRVGGHFEFSGLLEVQQMVRKARIEGATLETGEIRDVILGFW